MNIDRLQIGKSLHLGEQGREEEGFFPDMKEPEVQKHMD